MRTVILGGPKTGKTTLALALSRGPHPMPCRHTDSLIAPGTAFDRQAHFAQPWLATPGPWVIEGCSVAHALRLWLRTHAGQRPPVDKVILRRTAVTPQTQHQEALHKAVITVWQQIEPEVRAWPILIE